jgi:hypothetical protein
MTRFLMRLLVMRFTSDVPSEKGGKPEKPPDFGVVVEVINRATAFYWEMYGAQLRRTMS